MNLLTEKIKKLYFKYLSPFLDLHNGYLVNYTISERPVLSMVISMSILSSYGAQ